MCADVAWETTWSAFCRRASMDMSMLCVGGDVLILTNHLSFRRRRGCLFTLLPPLPIFERRKPFRRRQPPYHHTENIIRSEEQDM